MKKTALNILILSSPDITQAAGIIAYDLHRAFSNKHNSQILVRYSKHNINGVISYISYYQLLYIKLKNKLQRLVKNKTETDPNYYFFDINQKKTLIKDNTINQLINTPDVLIGYFMGNFFTIKDLYNLQKRYQVPVILIMADMVYITGGCHFAWKCNGYKKGCSDCPAIIEEKHKHFAKDNLTFNKELIDKMDVQIIAGSEQDYNYAKQSTLFKNKKVYKVFGGIDMSVFYYQNKNNLIKEKYKINPKNFVILFGAASITENRKGVKYFIEAIRKVCNKLEIENITIVSIGRGNLHKLLPDIHCSILDLGYISNYNQLAEIYNLGNILVTTTIQDSGPMMVNQSIACGTPVVCFDIGVAQDLVIEGKTGIKTMLYDTEGIANNILTYYYKSREEWKTIRQSCNNFAKENFTKELAAKKILKHARS